MTRFDLDRRLLETAARWRLRMEDADREPALIAQFESWLEASKAHRLAYERVGQAVLAVDVAADSERLTRWRAAALRQTRRSLRSLGVGWIGAAAAVLVIAVGLAILFAPVRSSPPQVYASSAGELLQINAADGTQISLDGASRIEVRYSRNLRRVDLIQGQARFQVVHNEARPFEVVAGERAIVDSGTDFDVDRMGSRVMVTLLSGRVVVARDDRPGASSSLQGGVSMQPGERLSGSMAGGPLALTHVSPDEAVVWQQGQILLDNETLNAAARYFGRYSDRPIRFADPKVADLRVSGVFSANDPEAFGRAVAMLHHVEAIAAPDGSITIEPARSPQNN